MRHKIKRFFFAIFLTSILFATASAHSALVEVDLVPASGDRLLTRDTNTGLDWLDLTQTLNLSFNDVQANVGGFISAGFRFATESEVRALYQSVGITNLTNTLPASSANFPGANLLLQLMGCTGGCATNSPFFQGLVELDGSTVPLSDPRAGQTVMVLDLAAQTARGAAPCCIGSKNDRSVAVGSYLVRPMSAAGQLNVNPAAYGGLWQIVGVTTEFTGPQTLNIGPGTYTVQIGDSRGRFDISIASNGDVTSHNAAAATGVGNALTFNTTLLTIDPGAYGNGSNRQGDYFVQRVASVRSFDTPGPQIIHVVANLGYIVQVGASANGRFNIDVAANGDVTSLNSGAASGLGNVLTFNSTLLTIDPGAYGNGSNNEGDYDLLNVTTVRSFETPGPRAIHVVPNLGYTVQVGASANGRFDISIAANGDVTSLNTAAAVGAHRRLTFRTARIDVNPDGFVSQWTIVHVVSATGLGRATVVPGLGYQFTAGSGSVLFSVASPCAVSPSQFVLGGFTFTIACGAPTANAGPDRTVNEGALVTLDGSASTDAESGPLTFSWTQVSGVTVSLNVSDPVRPTFTAPFVSAGGDVLTFQLVVNEATRNSEPDIVNIHVTNINNRPAADAGADQTVDEGSPVMLNGSNSYDPDAEPLSFSWIQTAGPVVSLLGSNTATPEFYAPSVGPAGGILTFQLTVSDGIDAATDSVNVLVENVNHRPVANAGQDQTRDEGSSVALNGTASNDPDGDAISFSWTQIAGPTVALSNSLSPTPSFTAPLVSPGGTALTFRLRVSDGLLSSLPDDEVDIRIVNVNDPPACALAQPSLATLWPPNHKLVAVGINNVSDPNNDQVTITITGVTQDEPVNGLGDGDSSPDAILQGDKVLLRVERAGNGNGRVYRVSFSANDGQGGACTGSVLVKVPKSMQPGNDAVDDGQLYNSTQP